jgi:2-polyprenyl-3-methyl-5-hydroxy-6-metoxy-1,4-benzoquinol methylase
MKKNAYKEMFAVEGTHWWYIGLHHLVQLLSERLFSNQILRILDAGCGTGGLLSNLSKAGHEVEGFDTSEDALKFCHKRGLKNVFQADINEWSPSPNTYDLIVSMDVLCHKWVHDEIKVLKSLATGLNDNGLIMINYPAFPILGRNHDKVVMIRERYTKQVAKKYLSEANLIPIILSYRLPHAFLLLLSLLPFETRKINGSETKSDIADIPVKFFNQFLILINKFENQFIARGLPMPFGSSLFVVAKKVNPSTNIGS